MTEVFILNHQSSIEIEVTSGGTAQSGQFLDREPRFPEPTVRIRGTDYELYEEDDEFVLSVEMPGFDPGEISASWDEGVLNTAAERDDRGERRTYHRRFRFPRDVDDEAITAEDTNGVPEVRLPVETGTTVAGRPIEVEA